MKKEISLAVVTIVLILAFAVVHEGAAIPSSESVSEPKIVAQDVNGPVTFGSADWSVSPEGAPGSGWKPDVVVANQPEHEQSPSIGSYIDNSTGTVTLYLAYRWLNPKAPQGPSYECRIARSLDRGATWALWRGFRWSDVYGFNATSLAVNTWNNTVFVATESSFIGGDGRIDVTRLTETTFESHPVATDADYRTPSLTVEYSWADDNYLYVSYEKRTTYEDRDLYFGKSADWGRTWSTKLLRGGVADTDVYADARITYAQRNLYIAYMHSVDWSTTWHIDVSYSLDYGSTWFHVENVSKVPNNARWPSVAGSRIGEWHKPATVMVAYEYYTTETNHDILITWSDDYGATWTGGNDYYHQIAASADAEWTPMLTVDGMGTERGDVGGNFHLIYWKEYLAFYTQLPYWDIPDYYGGPYPYVGYYLGWSSPHARFLDSAGRVGGGYDVLTITTHTKTVGADVLWEPAVAWIDFRSMSTNGWDIYYSTPDTDFNVTFLPSSQTVVAGKSISYYVTVNLLSGITAPAYLSGTNWPWIIPGTHWAKAEYSVSPITPTATSVLTVTTSNLMPPGNYQFNATATIGGYRRIVSIPFTVTAPPTITLDISPTTVARGSQVTFSGQLSPAPGAAATIYLYYRYPHETGAWKLAMTIKTDAAGAYSKTVTVPTTAPLGILDFVAFWVNTANGSYATSPIKVLTITIT